MAHSRWSPGKSLTATVMRSRTAPSSCHCTPPSPLLDLAVSAPVPERIAAAPAPAAKASASKGAGVSSKPKSTARAQRKASSCCTCSGLMRLRSGRFATSISESGAPLKKACAWRSCRRLRRPTPGTSTTTAPSSAALRALPGRLAGRPCSSGDGVRGGSGAPWRPSAVEGARSSVPGGAPSTGGSVGPSPPARATDSKPWARTAPRPSSR
mmetsp:Transcript_124381/g.277926  ORF Transcript_124381/g.277926 Transcript_124381/m.277926 type:complete len:211 (+) Transcript_124381:938-1570(+)